MGDCSQVPDDLRCEGITESGARCKQVGSYLSMGGQWCGQHHYGLATAPYTVAPWALVRHAGQQVPERVHGTVTGYTNHRCRCADCKAASAAYRAKRRAEATAEPVWDDVHGTLNGYTNYGCRCGRCTKAIREYNAQRRGSVPALEVP